MRSTILICQLSRIRPTSPVRNHPADVIASFVFLQVVLLTCKFHYLVQIACIISRIIFNETRLLFVPKILVRFFGYSVNFRFMADMFYRRAIRGWWQGAWFLIKLKVIKISFKPNGLRNVFHNSPQTKFLWPSYVHQYWIMAKNTRRM